MRDSAFLKSVAVCVWCEYTRRCTSDARMPCASVHLSTCLIRECACVCVCICPCVCAVAFVRSWCGVRVCVTCAYCACVV